MPKGTPKYIELIEEFEMAAIANATSGGGHPDDIPLKQKDYQDAKKKLIEFIRTKIYGRISHIRTPRNR
jgi:hypothetical protein